MSTIQEKTWVEISKSALRHNARTIRKHVAPCLVMGVVKANAYGHGIEVVSRTVNPDVDWFGVDNVNEAIQLRKIGITKPILILGYVDNTRLMDLVKHKLSVGAYNKEMLHAMGKLAVKKGAFRIHIKIETGTSRQGIEGKELDEFLKTALKIPAVRIEGVYTHYANIEDTTDADYAKSQMRRFREAIKQIQDWGVRPTLIHTASSGAALLYPETRYQMIRTGISLYGHWSSREVEAVAKSLGYKLQFRPSLTWKTKIAQAKTLKKGTPVSYGLTFKLTRPSKIAVVPVGYSDGYSRQLSSLGYVLVRGERAEVVGRVCMNMMMIDVTDIKNVKLGDEVVLLGGQGSDSITAESIASKIDTIQYTVLCNINPSIPRILVA